MDQIHNNSHCFSSFTCYLSRLKCPHFLSVFQLMASTPIPNDYDPKTPLFVVNLNIHKIDMQLNHMTDGTQESSYAQNSEIQAHSISKTLPVIKEALKGLYSSNTPKCVMAAELGCASGPNALMLIPELVRFIDEKFIGKEMPQIQVFLNDLYYNDFNTVSRSLMTFLRDSEKEQSSNAAQKLFISMTPGSFHKRIFPNNFLHFVHCANSAHWLSKVPNALSDNDGNSLMKGHIYITKTSPPEVSRAYEQQFAEDFFAFLKFRAQEIIKGGRMVINIMVSSETHGPDQMWVFKLMNMVVDDMLLEGLVDEEQVDKVNIPFYPPTMKEVNKLVLAEGSFKIGKHEMFSLPWDMPNPEDRIDVSNRARFVAGTARVATEYMISEEFGDVFAQMFFQRFTHLVCKFLATGNELYTLHQIISLIRK